MFRTRNISQLSIFIFCFLIFLLSLPSLSYSQRNYLFENISIPEGLSNSTVQYLFQDNNGFLWISTADGLNRYDGNSIKVFKNDPNDSTTLPNNYCSAIAEDADGFIWIGVFGNIIARFDPKTETFMKYPIATGSVTDVSDFFSALSDSKENLWFGSTNHGMQRFNRSKNKFEQVFPDSSNKNTQWGEIHNVVELKNGNILASDYANGIKIYNEKLNEFQPYNLKTNYSPIEIAHIFEDASGNIWFGGRDQLIKYSPSYYTTDDYDLFSLIKIPTNYDNVTGIAQDYEGYLWVVIYSQGLYRVDINTKDIKAFDYKSKNSDNSRREIIGSIYKDKYGVIWIGTWYQGLIKFDPLREPFKYSKFISDEDANSNANIVTVIAGSQQYEEITIGTSADGLYSYDLENNKSVNLKIKFNQSTIPDGSINIQSLAIDNEGNKWFSYNNLGLHKLDKAGVLSFIKSPHEKKTSTYNMNGMKIDLSGNIWFTSENGFEKYNPAKNEFALLPTIMTKKMSQILKQQINKIPESREPNSSILKVGEASNLEKKFSLNQDQKVLILCLGEGRMVQGNDGLFDKGSLLTEDGKLIWSMNDLSRTFNDGGGFKNRIAIKCMKLKKGDYKITFASDVGHSYGNWNVAAPPDSIWWGIQVLSLTETEYNTINELTEKEINSNKYLPTELGRSIELSKRFYNVLWLGSTTNSFFKYDLATGNFKQYNYDTKTKFSPNNFVSFIFEDREGIVWVATLNSLVRFDPMTEKIDKYDQRDGLPSSLVNSITEDLQGNLWISTSAGLSKLNKNAPKDKWNFVNFDSRDGLQGSGSSKASWISKDGEIFLGSIDGITSFYPGKINAVKPDIVLEDIKVSDISLKSDSAIVKLKKSIMKLDELDLSYTQNNISFEFASIHFSRPEKNKIIYKLEGFNNDWISTDRNYASYTNLEPGEYTFRVKGSNGDGIWNDEGKAIRIIISPPWWRTTVAYIGYVFLFAGIVFVIDRFQRRRIVNTERNAAAIKEANLRAQLAETENERKSKELEEARQLQLSMLPKVLPQLPHLDIAVYMKTATEVGGDYYDFNVAMDGTLTVVLGDATGHGMRAGTMVTSAKTLFNSYAANPDILFTFKEMTRCIKQMQFQSLAMSMTMLKIQNNKLMMSAAGMPPVYLYRNKHKILEEHLMEGMPLGTMDNFPYELKEVELFKGDTLLLMSDGFPELHNQDREMFGYKRARNSFEEVAEKEPEEIISYLQKEGTRWANDKDPDDDVTFVVIKIK
ncbi:MAG: SpoIIE family protein phosphatase [Candidatus Marinimicrobia bacterium]|nr:SpoIIE family protein phosphatase [Candidatus Neomarinimicrobiota bacterium]